MVEFTILKVDVEDAQFTANSPFGRDGGSDGTGDGSAVEGLDAADESGGRGAVRALLGLTFLVAATVLVRRYLSGDESEEEFADLGAAGTDEQPPEHGLEPDAGSEPTAA